MGSQKVVRIFLDTHSFEEEKLCVGSDDDAGWNAFFARKAVPVAHEKILPPPSFTGAPR